MRGLRVVWLVRHGERIDNVCPEWKLTAERWDDPPLSVRGNEQATEVGARLAGEPLDAILCSPFTRCVQTAGKILDARGGRPLLCIEPGFSESLNACADPPGRLPLHELIKLEPRIDASYQPVLEKLEKEVGGDICCAPRIRRVIEAVLGRFTFDRILIVSHGSPIAAAHEALVGRWNYVGQCTVSRIVELPPSALTPPLTPDPARHNPHHHHHYLPKTNTSTNKEQRWMADLVGCKEHLSDKSNLHEEQKEDKLYGRESRAAP